MIREADIVHCHLTYATAFGGLLATTRVLGGWRRTAVVETVHSVGMAISPLRRRLHAAMLSAHDGVALMAHDAFWDAFVDTHPTLPTAYIENGIAVSSGPDAVERAAYRRMFDIPDGAPIAGTVGQFRDDRQPWRFIPVFAEMARRVAGDMHFIMGGDGPAMDRVRQAVAQHGLEGRVHLPGLVPAAALPASIMDVYLTLAVGGIVGLAALEAVLTGPPVVAIQLRDDYATGRDDWFYSDRDEMAVATAASALLSDDAARRALATRQRAHVVDRYSVTAMANAYELLYERARSKRGGR